MKEIPKNKAVLGTAQKLREVLMSKYKTFNMPNNITCSTKRKYRTTATLYTVET